MGKANSGQRRTKHYVIPPPIKVKSPKCKDCTVLKHLETITKDIERLKDDVSRVLVSLQNKEILAALYKARANRPVEDPKTKSDPPAVEKSGSSGDTTPNCEDSNCSDSDCREVIRS